MMFVQRINLLFLCCLLLITNISNGQLNVNQSTFFNAGIVAPIKSASLLQSDMLNIYAQQLLMQHPLNLQTGLTEMHLQTMQKIVNLHLQNKMDAEHQHLVTPLQQNLYAEQAKNYFRNKMYKEAIVTYNLLSNKTLTNLQIVEKNFNLAYSYLNTNQDNEVMPLMASLVNIDGDYFQSGNYYYGMLQFYNGNYSEAMNSFLKIRKDKEYKKVVPYYLTALFYFQGQKDTALQYAEQMLNDDKANLYFREELNLLAGQIHFENKSYDKAIPYIENYIADAAVIRREDLFLLGFSHYQTGSIAKATNVLSRVKEDLDTVSQMTNYVLGDCYLKQGKKDEAKDAFQKVLNIDGIPLINEISRYHFASLSYEANIDDDALNASYNLLQKYPNTIYKTECLNMIGNLLSSTKNYEGALKVIREFKENNQIKTAYQKIAFNQAMIILKEGKDEKALALLSESDKNSNDADLKNYSDFWKSEIYYQQKKYGLAEQYATAFITNAKSEQGDANINNAYLIITYIAIKDGNDTLANMYINKIFASKNDNYLLANAIELNKINTLLEALKNIEKINNDKILVIKNGLYNNNLDITKSIIGLDSLKNLKPYQTQQIVEIKLMQDVQKGNFSNALPKLQQINYNNKTLQYYTLLCAIGLKNTDEINKLASINNTSLDTTNEWQAKIIVQLFDWHCEKLNVQEATGYYSQLQQFKLLPYAKIRLPIKAKMLKALVVNPSKTVEVNNSNQESNRVVEPQLDTISAKKSNEPVQKKDTVVKPKSVLKKVEAKKESVKNINDKKENSKKIDAKKQAVKKEDIKKVITKKEEISKPDIKKKVEEGKQSNKKTIGKTNAKESAKK